MLSGHVLPLAGVYSQGLDGLQRGKESLADGLQLVVIEGEQVEILQVLKCVHAQTVDLVGIEEAASRREASDSVILPLPCGARLCPQVTGYRLRVCLTATAPAAESGRWGSGRGELLHPCGPRNSTHIWHQIAWVLRHRLRSPGAFPVPSGGRLKTAWPCFPFCFRMQSFQELQKQSLGTIVLNLLLIDKGQF